MGRPALSSSCGPASVAAPRLLAVCWLPRAGGSAVRLRGMLLKHGDVVLLAAGKCCEGAEDETPGRAVVDQPA